MLKKATLCSSLLVRRGYEVFFPHLVVLDPYLFIWFGYHLNSCVLMFSLCCVQGMLSIIALAEKFDHFQDYNTQLKGQVTPLQTQVVEL